MQILPAGISADATWRQKMMSGVNALSAAGFAFVL
jgi:hypothetical protein